MNSCLVLIGRGVEGCGVTSMTIEIEKYLKSKNVSTVVVAGADKKWNRDTAQTNDFIYHKFTVDAYKDSNKYDMCIITSVPPRNIMKTEEESEKVYDNFISTLTSLRSVGTRIVYLQCDNKIHSITRNFYAIPKYTQLFFDTLDRVIVHNVHADFVTKFIDTKLSHKNFTIGQQVLISSDFDEIKSIVGTDVKKIDKTCWFIGRSARWKGWREFRDFHTSTLRKNGYVSVIEGIELSINAKEDLCGVFEKGNYVVRDDNIYYLLDYDNKIEHDINKLNVEDCRDMPTLIYGPFARNEALNRVSKSKFGMFFTFTGPEFGGQIEITFLEIVGAGTVPVIRKELWDHAFFNDKYLKDIGTPEDVGIVVYDSNNPEKCLELMNKLNNDDELYKTYVDKATKFCKSEFNREYIIKRLIDKCMSNKSDLNRPTFSQINLFDDLEF